ncbi:MAG: hypothetical protein IT573_06070 [Deltaproteobacteria bacterium]|nr:hypothetical protein [Deltaproteobacteria bacterium]
MHGMKRVGAMFKIWVLALMGLGIVGCGSGDGNGGGGGGGGGSLDPVAQYFVTQFLATNTADSNNVIDGEAKGLSLYMTLNADNSLNATAQTPDGTPKSTAMTGTWSSSGGNQLSITLIDQDNQARTISGSLAQDASGMVSFQGAQTGGAPINFGDSGAAFTITTFAMAQYPEGNITLADIAGNYTATAATAIANQGDMTENMLSNGLGMTLAIGADGSITSTITQGANPPEVDTGTVAVADNFHLTVNFGNEPETVLFRFVDEMLTVYIYDTNYTFQNQTVSVSVTQVLEFTKE